MLSTASWHRTTALFLATVGAVAALILSVGTADERRSFSGEERTGGPRLVSVEPLPEEGATCGWGPNGRLVQIRGVALDPKNKSVIVSDKRLNALLTYSFPEIF